MDEENTTLFLYCCMGEIYGWKKISIHDGIIQRFVNVNSPIDSK